MPIQSSFATVANQITTFNKNIIETLSKINSLSTTTNPSVDVQIIDVEGVLRSYSLPSFTFLKTEIERLNNSINSLYSIDTAGALIQTSTTNKFKKIITVDLNREPSPVSDLGLITEFKSEKNWFFDGLLNPQLFIELDLSDKIENNVRKILSRRYIIEFTKDSSGQLTSLGQSALNSFNTLYRGKNNIDLSEFETWHTTTPGLINPLNVNYDEQMFDLIPNVLLYDGVFSVLDIEEDTLNRKLYYRLDKLDYLVNETLKRKQLAKGDELIINQENSNTKYKIVEISNSESDYRVRLERIEGLQPIPVATNSLKIYSPVVYRKRVRTSIGYNERNVMFVKPVNADVNLVAKDWSKGSGFYTNDLKLSSNNSGENGLSMEQYYLEFVYDYGEVLQDLVAQKTPIKLAGIPNVVSLINSNFRVVQINKQLTETTDANLLINKYNYLNTLKSEITQIELAIVDKRNKLRQARYSDEKSRSAAEMEITQLENKKNSLSTLAATTNSEIISLSASPSSNVAPKYRVRGFWNIPEPIVSLGNRDNRGSNTVIIPQEVVQFRVQYKYVSKDGSEPTVETFNLAGVTAAFSEWVEFKTDVRKRIFDEVAKEYFWQIEDVESADTPNITQLDIPINPNEQVQIRIKSISEVGWPESPVESNWSEILTIPFPGDLNNVLNDNDFILKEASREDLRVTMTNTLDGLGLKDHLADSYSINEQVFYHSTDRILSNFRGENGLILGLSEYLRKLEDRIRMLEDKITRVKGEFEVVVRQLTQEFTIENNSETGFTVELEDYLQNYTEDNEFGTSRARRYINKIYTIPDFTVIVRNKSLDSPLGLLSNRDYSASSIYNSAAPQVFWVTPDHELLFTDVSGSTRTQLNNQFIWCLNYDSVTQNNISKVSENIGNSFVDLGNNSLVEKLSLTEYNLGYSENTAINFVSSNNSLTDTSKWIDTISSVSSETKLLTTIHPVINSLETLVENNEDKVKTMNGNTEFIIPISIYFKMNSLDDTKKGNEVVDLNTVTTTTTHVKKLKFFLEDENKNRPFIFTLKFTLNRNKLASQSRPLGQLPGFSTQTSTTQTLMPN